jgi:hypothetical protein
LIQLDPQAGLWLDVAVFEQAYQLVRDVPGEQLDPGQVPLIQEAVACYRGDLLAGWYQDWCLCERERLQFLYLSLLDKLIRYCQAGGDYEAGRLYAYQIILRRARIPPPADAQTLGGRPHRCAAPAAVPGDPAAERGALPDPRLTGKFSDELLSAGLPPPEPVCRPGRTIDLLRPNELAVVTHRLEPPVRPPGPQMEQARPEPETAKDLCPGPHLRPPLGPP